MGRGATAAAGKVPPFFLTNKLAPSAVFAVNNSTEKVAAEDESSPFAGGGMCRVSAGTRGGGGRRAAVIAALVGEGPRGGFLRRGRMRAHPRTGIPPRPRRG